MTISTLEDWAGRAAAVLAPAPARSRAAPRPRIGAVRHSGRLQRERGAALRELPDPLDPDNRLRAAPDWQAVRDLAAECLDPAQPDLEAACWWLEAAVESGGLAGLAAGIDLCAALLTQSWDVLGPRPHADELSGDAQEDDAAIRRSILAPLGAVLTGRLPEAVARIAVWQFDDDTQLTLESYRLALSRPAKQAELAALENAAKKPERKDALAPRIDTLRKLLAGDAMQPWVETRASLLEHTAAMRDFAAAVAAAREAMQRLTEALAGRHADGIISVTALASVLAALAELAAELAPAAPHEAPRTGPAAMPSKEGPAMMEDANPAIPARPAPLTRDRAIAMLLEAAAFFRVNEPQSPVGEVLEEVARRARLSWSELLGELVQDQSMLTDLRVRLGLKVDAGVKPAG